MALLRHERLSFLRLPWLACPQGRCLIWLVLASTCAFLVLFLEKTIGRLVCRALPELNNNYLWGGPTVTDG
jgi:hypothetical protein